MLDLLNRLVKEEDGQGMVEYGLIIGVLALGLVVALGSFKDELGNWFTSISNKLKATPAGTTTTTTT